jgi:hypothetical protein
MPINVRPNSEPLPNLITLICHKLTMLNTKLQKLSGFKRCKNQGKKLGCVAQRSSHNSLEQAIVVSNRAEH